MYLVSVDWLLLPHWYSGQHSFGFWIVLQPGRFSQFTSAFKTVCPSLKMQVSSAFDVPLPSAISLWYLESVKCVDCILLFLTGPGINKEKEGIYFYVIKYLLCMSSIYHNCILVKRKEAEIIEIPFKMTQKLKKNKKL